MDTSSRARTLSQTLFSPTASAAEREEARAELQVLALRGEHIAVEALREAPAASSQTEQQPAPPGITPAFAALLAEADEAIRAASAEHKRLAPVRAVRQAELEAAMSRAHVAESWKHGYRRTLEVYQENYSFEEETKVFEAVMTELGRLECKQTSKE